MRGTNTGTVTGEHRSRRTARRGPLAVTATALAAACLVTGCGDHTTDQDATPTAPVEAVRADDQNLSVTLTGLVAPGARVRDVGSCLTSAVRAAGLSEEGLVVLADHSGRAGADPGSAVAALVAEHPDDARLLVRTDTQDELDVCVDDAVGTTDNQETTYAAPGPAVRPEDPAADTTPRYEVHDSQEITSASEMSRGLASVLGSYARDEDQRLTYVAASPCVAQAVLDAGFTRETMRFLISGPPLGTGDLSDHLPVPEDRERWASREFTLALDGCVQNVTRSDREEAAEREA